MATKYRAAMMDAQTGGSKSYVFEAGPDLFHRAADDIVDTFIHSLESYDGKSAPLSYELNSAIKKIDKAIVMATGSLNVDRGEIPFLLLISPAVRN